MNNPNMPNIMLKLVADDGFIMASTYCRRHNRRGRFFISRERVEAVLSGTGGTIYDSDCGHHVSIYNHNNRLHITFDWLSEYSDAALRGINMIYAATEGPCSLIIEQDDSPVDPRIDFDNMGHMVCWHRRYSLGDGHHYEDPEAFLRDLYRGSIRDDGKRLVEFLKSGAARGAKLIYNRHTREWELYTCYCLRTVLGKSDLSWELEQSAPKDQLNVNGWFFDYMLEALTIDDLKELLSAQKDIVILPLYLYDHSGLSMSTGSFVGRAVHAEWDSGQVGFIYATREDIQCSYGEVTPETIRRAAEVLEGEVKEYDTYLRGDCWGFRTYVFGHEMDSCWGFIGDIDDIREDIKSFLSSGWSSLVDKLEPRGQSVKEYLYDAIVA